MTCLQVARIVSFAGRNSYIALAPESVDVKFEMTMKFKTTEKDGLLFYTSDESASHVSGNLTTCLSISPLVCQSHHLSVNLTTRLSISHSSVSLTLVCQSHHSSVNHTTCLSISHSSVNLTLVCQSRHSSVDLTLICQSHTRLSITALVCQSQWMLCVVVGERVLVVSGCCVLL